MKSLIRDCTRLYEHVRDVINNAQHGFLRGRSCVTQLLGTLHQIGKLLDQTIQTDVLFLVFAKAFDLVDHDILFKKLKGCGTAGNRHNLSS